MPYPNAPIATFPSGPPPPVAPAYSTVPAHSAPPVMHTAPPVYAPPVYAEPPPQQAPPAYTPPAAAAPPLNTACRASLLAALEEAGIGVKGDEAWVQVLDSDLMDREALLMCEASDLAEFGLPKGVQLKLRNWARRVNGGSTVPPPAPAPAPAAPPAKMVVHSGTGECPITRCAMTNPVLLVDDGTVYERSAIEHWLKSHGTSPMTREKLAFPRLEPVVKTV